MLGTGFSYILQLQCVCVRHSIWWVLACLITSRVLRIMHRRIVKLSCSKVRDLIEFVLNMYCVNKPHRKLAYNYRTLIFWLRTYPQLSYCSSVLLAVGTRENSPMTCKSTARREREETMFLVANINSVYPANFLHIASLLKRRANITKLFEFTNVLKSATIHSFALWCRLHKAQQTSGRGRTRRKSVVRDRAPWSRRVSSWSHDEKVWRRDFQQLNSPCSTVNPAWRTNFQCLQQPIFANIDLLIFLKYQSDSDKKGTETSYEESPLVLSIFNQLYSLRHINRSKNCSYRLTNSILE